MPRASRPCPTPGCPNLQPCQLHAPKPWANSRRKERRGGSGWAEQREHQAVLRRDGHRCYLCGEPATEVDDVTNLAAGGTPTRNNKRAICTTCHRHKTAAEAAAARRGGG